MEDPSKISHALWDSAWLPAFPARERSQGRVSHDKHSRSFLLSESGEVRSDCCVPTPQLSSSDTPGRLSLCDEFSFGSGLVEEDEPHREPSGKEDELRQWSLLLDKGIGPRESAGEQEGPFWGSPLPGLGRNFLMTNSSAVLPHYWLSSSGTLYPGSVSQ